MAYFEVKILKLSDKEYARFGIGIAKSQYPHLRVVGGKNSVAVRGDGKVFAGDLEEKQCQNIFEPLASASQYDFSLDGCVIGCGFEKRSSTVFFTVNGREVASVESSSTVFENISADQLHATFSMGNLDDKIQVNFGQAPFLFNIKAKTTVSQYYIF